MSSPTNNHSKDLIGPGYYFTNYPLINCYLHQLIKETAGAISEMMKYMTAAVSQKNITDDWNKDLASDNESATAEKQSVGIILQNLYFSTPVGLATQKW